MGYNTGNMYPVQLACLGRDRDGACTDGVKRFLGGPSSFPNSVLKLHRFPKERIPGWDTHKHLWGITTRIAIYKGEKEHVGKTYDHTTGSLPSSRKNTPEEEEILPNATYHEKQPFGQK
jgi:hypothetical protein